PEGHCDPVDGAPLLAGTGVVSIVPTCFEAWVDVDADAEYEPPGEEFRDCGCDRLCPGDPGYVAPDAGEGDGEFQAVWLAGFHNGRPATGVRGGGVGLVGDGDGLWARALVLEQGNTKVAIVTLDLVGFFHNETLALRQTLADQGLDIDYLLIHALHNHEGPDSMGLWGPQQLVSGYDPNYRAQLHAAIVDAIVAAEAAKTEVAAMIVGEVDVSTYHTNGVGNVVNDRRDPFIIDEMLGALRLVDAQDNTIATIVSFGNHPEALSDENTLITSDFAHAFRRTVEQGSQWKFAPGQPGVGGTCLYLNAAVGGLMTPLGMTVTTPDGESYSSGSFDKADAIGQLLGEMALDALQNGDVVPAPRLDVQAQKYKVRVDNANFQLLFGLGFFDRETFMEMDGMYIETESALLNLGPAQFLTVPGELFPELAIGGYDGSHINHPFKSLLKPNNPNPPDLQSAPEGPYLKDRMHGTYRFIVGLGNDELGYILPEYDFILGDPPWITEAPGDHYEETNSLGPETFSKIEAAADVLIAWSKWVHGVP
ncbi:MAG TPA: neutral/alkaline non-lysosomal ceramidase N-terminal domain-containing protein, partial [Nannocystis sp.]